jgi:hypothetical protein
MAVGQWLLDNIEVRTEFSKFKEDNMSLVPQPPSRSKTMCNVLALILPDFEPHTRLHA